MNWRLTETTTYSIGAIVKGSEIGLGKAHKYIWSKCPACDEERWAMYSSGSKRSAIRLCRRCQIQRWGRQGKTRKQPEQEGCVHYWIIEPATSRKSLGICSKCDAEKEHDNYIDFSFSGDPQKLEPAESWLSTPPVRTGPIF